MIFNAKTILFYMHFGNGSKNDDFVFNEIKLPNSFEKEVIINLNLNHILEAQKQISSFLKTEKDKLISNAVRKSQFSYCCLVILKCQCSPQEWYQENSHRKIPTRKITTQEIPTWNIPIHVFKTFPPKFLNFLFFHYCHRHH